MVPQNVDCALFFALKEEFEIITTLKEVEIEGDYYYFHFNDKDNNRRKCIAGYVGFSGELQAFRYSQKFYKQYTPHVVFVIGISGQISDDVKLGDIVVAKSVDNYDNDAKFKNGEIKFSGQVINLEFMGDDLLQIPTRKAGEYKEWQMNADKQLRTCLNKAALDVLVNRNLLRNTLKTESSYGKIASGIGVVDDPRIKSLIQSKDRKLLCVDMESYGFASCDENPNMIIVRAVSDTADGAKKELDEFMGNSNSIRKWGLENAFTFLDNILLKIIDFPETSGNSAEVQSQKMEEVDAAIAKKGSEAFDAYGRLFDHLLKKPETFMENFTFPNFLDCVRQTSGATPVIVQGSSGSGKTTLLYTFVNYLRSQNISCEYLNLHRFKTANVKDIADVFESKMSRLLSGESGICIVIDGIDLYERFFKNKEINLNKYWAFVSKRFDHIVLGVTVQDYDNDDDTTQQFYLRYATLKFDLSYFDFDDSNIDRLITDLQLVNSTTLPGRNNKVRAFFRDNGLSRIDWHTANLIVNNIGTFSYEKTNSLGKFLHTYSSEHFTKIDEPDGLSAASELAFRKFIKEEKLSPAEYSSVLWSFIQSSATIRHFLIAEHLIRRYSTLAVGSEDNWDDLKYIYSFKINTYFKDNLDKKKSIQRDIYQSITRSFDKLSIFQKPNVCYILGRLTDREITWDISTFLGRQLSIELAAFHGGIYKQDNRQFRQHLLLIRTIFISLAYQRDKAAADQYLDYLLSNREWDDLNRGFHLEYYDDKPYDRLEFGLHNDDLQINFEKTYARLSKKIQAYIDHPRAEAPATVFIELQTLTSLAINRHFVHRLESKIGAGVVKILEAFQKDQITLMTNSQMKSYIDFALYILKKQDTSHFTILKDFYNIKAVKRSGWNYRGIKDGVEIVREVKDAESVADHLYAAVMLAILHLPDEYPGFNDYSKMAILKTIIIHDLAESFEGDIISFLKTESKRRAEDSRMKVILSMGLLDGFGDLEELRTLWESYKSQDSINAKVAREIDKIENLIQLEIYHEKETNVISDYDNWKAELTGEVSTTLGLKILRSILRGVNASLPVVPPFR